MIKAKKYVHYFKTQEDFIDKRENRYWEPWVSATVLRGGVGIVDSEYRVDYNKRPEDKYFYWGDAGEAEITAVTTSSGETVITISYRTNYEPSEITASCIGDFQVTSVVFNNGVCTINVPENTSTSVREADINVMVGQEAVAVVELTQQAKSLHFLWSNGLTAITIDMASTATTTSIGYTTNMTGLTITSSATYTWVTQKGLTNTSGDGNFTANTQINETENDRTGVFYIKQGQTTVGTLNLKQGKKYPYFRFMKLGNAEKEGIYFDQGEEIGPDGLTVLAYSGASGDIYIRIDVVTSGYSGSFSVTTDNSAMFTGITNSVTPTAPYDTGFCTARCSNNNDITERTGSIIISLGSTVMAKVTVKQEAQPYFYWYNTGTDTATTVTIDNTDTAVSISYRTNYTGLTTYINYQYTNFLTSSGLTNTGGSGSFTGTTASGATGEKFTKGIQIRSGGKQVGALNVLQFGNETGVIEIVYRANQEYDVKGIPSTQHSFSDAIFKVLRNGETIATLDASSVAVWYIYNAKRINNDNWCYDEENPPKLWGDPDYSEDCWRTWAHIDHNTGLFTYNEGGVDMGAQIYANVVYDGVTYPVFICCIRYNGGYA